jgi:uncharacterized protein
VSNPLPSREQAIQLLKECNCSTRVINHCLAVTDVALEFAGRLQKKGLKIDRQLVEAGALLHDLGRSKTHTVDHAVVGAQMAKSLGLPESVVKIIKRHVGAGITADEARQMGWPEDVYVPQSLEEKVVSYADKLVDQSGRIPIAREFERLQNENKSDAAERVRKLNKEMMSLLDDKP